jgi:hypothetical protein
MSDLALPGGRFAYSAQLRSVYNFLRGCNLPYINELHQLAIA